MVGDLKLLRIWYRLDGENELLDWFWGRDVSRRSINMNDQLRGSMSSGFVGLIHQHKWIDVQTRELVPSFGHTNVLMLTIGANLAFMLRRISTIQKFCD